MTRGFDPSAQIPRAAGALSRQAVIQREEEDGHIYKIIVRIKGGDWVELNRSNI